MSDRRFLILHGLEGPGPDHWYTWLADRLATAGARVRLPSLPRSEAPELEGWLDALRTELAALGPGEPTVICHSLGCVLWLHHLERGDVGERADRVLLVAPPCPNAPIPDAESFWPTPLDAERVHRGAGTTRLVCSNDDPYCPQGAAPAYAAPVGIDVDVLPGAGHINPDSGFGPWPEVEEWCLGRRETLQKSSS